MSEIRTTGVLTRPDEERPVARVECEIWVIDPQDDLPGKWGGRVEVIEDLGLSAADFMFRLVLDDGRTADCFVDFNYDSGSGLIDGNGPPPGVSMD